MQTLLSRLQKSPESITVGVVGLGYVGLPLAVSLARTFKVVGYDRSTQRVRQIQSGEGLPEPLQLKEIQALGDNLALEWEAWHLGKCDIVIVAVPTDINEAKIPDLEPLLQVAGMLDRVMPQNRPWGLCVESTVWPGCTEEIVIPELTRHQDNPGFFYGFSPERIVPGSPLGKHHGEGMGLHNTNKLVSGSCPDALEIFRLIYTRIVTEARVVPCPSVRVAEASKMLENIQRDTNIALVNEYASACEALGVKIHDVLEAAGTKWNFHPYKPGLVGGHCIGVDPYYMLYRAQQAGVSMPIIRAARGTNEAVPQEMATRIVRDLLRRKCELHVLVVGVGFKENCDDLRNSKVLDLVKALREWGCSVDVHDPVVNQDRIKLLYGPESVKAEMPQEKHLYGAVVLATPHAQILEEISLKWLLNLVAWQGGIVYDIKKVYTPKGLDQLRAYRSW